MSKLSRRSLISSAAVLPVLTVPALSLPAIASAADPIFAIIKRYELEWERLGESCHAEPPYKKGRADTPEFCAWQEEQDEIHWALSDAKDEMLSTPPTTAAGAAAFLRFVIADMEMFESRWQKEALETIASALSIGRVS